VIAGWRQLKVRLEHALARCIMSVGTFQGSFAFTRALLRNLRLLQLRARGVTRRLAHRQPTTVDAALDRLAPDFSINEI